MVGGNIKAEIQLKRINRNAIGEMVEEWSTDTTLWGFLDYVSGDSRYEMYQAKIQESSHVFICDYIPLKAEIKPQNARLSVGGTAYDITLIDNPMGLGRQLEIYLKLVEG